ncbi:unnamed protein product, partial [Brassica rapa]
MHIRLTMKGTIWDPPKFIVPKNCSVFEMLRFSDRSNLEISDFLLLTLLSRVEGS